MHLIKITGESLDLDDVRAILSDEARISLSPKAIANIKKSYSIVVNTIKKGETIYGVTTGFGRLSDQQIPPDKWAALQRNVVLSHATGIGKPISTGETKLMMAFRINSLAKGFSGVSLEMINQLINMFNRGVSPLVPSQGSAGASGDLAPLAHIGAGMMGIGEAIYKGKNVSASAALKKAGLKPYQFKPKEGISLINGTQFMTALLGGAIVRIENLLKVADIAGAMSIEAMKGSAKPFDLRVQNVRAHPGQKAVALNFRKLLQDSEIQKSHEDCGKVQDAYSLRCIPQVHGAVRDTFEYAKHVFLREINSAVDNPLVFSDEIISAGNFHGQPIAQAADALAIALTTLGNISERRIERLTNPDLSGLPAFLSKDAGLNSGMMVFQVAASALCAENRTLAYPASVTSLPTSAAKEDHTSMGPISVRHLKYIAGNLEYILSIEALCSAQGLEFSKPLRPGKGVSLAYNEIRRNIKPLEEDRYMKQDLESVKRLITSNFVKAIEGKTGESLC